jgi:NADH:ubiquinone oxidoreductase subunit D
MIDMPLETHASDQGFWRWKKGAEGENVRKAAIKAIAGAVVAATVQLTRKLVHKLSRVARHRSTSSTSSFQAGAITGLLQD